MIDMHIHAVNPRLPGVKTLPTLLDGPPGPIVSALREQMRESGAGAVLGMGHLGGSEDDPLGIASTLKVVELLPELHAIGVADPTRTDSRHMQSVERQIRTGKVKALKGYLGYLHHGPDSPGYVPYYELAATWRQLDAYVAGVRAGLGSLKARPFEYLLLSETPKPWCAEDSVLVMLALFIDLQSDNIAKESARGVLRAVLPRPLAEFLSPRGSIEWDAPMFGGPIAPPPVPGAQVFDLRNESVSTLDPTPWYELEDYGPGSNNWALAGSRTDDGRAWVANDMHLYLRVPNTWYRVCLGWPEESSSRRRTAVGVTVPGGPGIVVGSNGRIAWGFTNTQGDWSDLIELDIDPEKPGHYRTPEGYKRFETHQETLRIKGRPDERLTVESTIWGPVIGADHEGKKRVLHWVAGDQNGINLGLLKLSLAQSLEEGLEQANRCGAPHQNIVIADDQGRIAWTILGRIPRRIGFDGRVPESWADGLKRWEGYLSALPF